MPEPKPPRLRNDGGPDGRGHGEGSKASRFAKDDNRRRPGRTKGALSLGTIYRTAGGAIITLTLQNGKTRSITKAEGVILKQLELALKGDQRAAERFLEKYEQYSPTEAQTDLTEVKLIEDQDILASAYLRGLISADEPASPSVAEAVSTILPPTDAASSENNAEPE